MSKKFVVIGADRDEQLRKLLPDMIKARDPEERIVVHMADSKEAFKTLFDAHRDVRAIILPGRLSDGTTSDLVPWLRDSGYIGPIVATSGDPDHQRELVDRWGCIDCPKPWTNGKPDPAKMVADWAYPPP
jgi:hypothetical protein